MARPPGLPQTTRAGGTDFDYDAQYINRAFDQTSEMFFG
jgi:hypothetical protein